MELLKKTGWIFIISISFSCSTSSKFNKEIRRLDTSSDLFTYKENYSFFNYIKKELVHCNYIYYITSTIDNQNDFRGIMGVVFDENNNIIYNLEYNEDKDIILRKNFSIDSNAKSLDDAYNQFIYSTFKYNSCDSLLKLSNKTKNISGIGSEDRIYKIDLKNREKNKVCSFQRIFYYQDLYEQQLNNN